MCNGPSWRLYFMMEFIDPTNPTNEELSRYLWDIIPKEQQERVFLNSNARAELSNDFAGFVSTYWHLAKILPKDLTIYDFGCGYNAQSYFFTEFEGYIAVDPCCVDEVFQPDNCDVFAMTAREFVTKFNIAHNSFAIVNYVPQWSEDVIDLIHDYFPHCYTFYPVER